MKTTNTLITLVASITLALSFSSQVSAASVNNDTISQKSDNETDEFIKAYEAGRSKGILNDENMSKSNFIELCKKSVFPAYLEYSKDNPTVSFAQYIADDNYEVPRLQPGDHPTTVRANDESDNGKYSALFPSLIAAHSGYSMKAGDILICYGSDSMGKYVGHAAIATSANYILEMPGTLNGRRSAKNNARHISKKDFFTTYANGSGKYVSVYRMKDHPIISDHASTYAYRYMYKTGNPTYSLVAQAQDLYTKSPSYCSKYVYYAYYQEDPSTVFMPPTPILLRPHNLMNQFMPAYKVSYIHKITRY
ncbi:hypothetical protein [Lactobacillus sp. PSON]|uniref:hypothetical protein n=1 Tax=Lactobacillus sp. PSON TaxID=3455454 RepID=UPI004041722C